MKKAEIIDAINALELEGVNIEENTKLTVPELALMLKGAESDEIIAEYGKENKRIAAELERFQKGGGKAVMPRLKVDGKTYEATLLRFQLPKREVTTAKDLAEREDPQEIKEAIEKGVFVLVEKED